MMLELLIATRFEKVMGSGRTQPCLLVCENEAGEEVEVVAKLRGHPQIMPGGLLAEAVSSLLALDLDLPEGQNAVAGYEAEPNPHISSACEGSEADVA